MERDKYGDNSINAVDILSQPGEYLSVNVEEDIVRDDEVFYGPVAALYYAPHSLEQLKKGEGDSHYHILLSREEATRLKDWLEAFLKDPSYSEGP